MSDLSCLACYAPTSNGLALCERCQARASIYLEFLPVYFRNLARWRPGRAGSRPVPGSREPQGVGVSSDDRVSRALDEVGNDIVGWARKLGEDRGIVSPESDGEAAQATTLCRLFAENLTSIATLEWCGGFVEAMGRNEAWLRGLTEKVAPGWYAGACQHCALPTFVVPGLTWVTCHGCGVITYARDHLDTILDEARGWVARPKPLAEALVALLDSELSVPKVYTRIRQWAHQGDLEPIRRTRRDYVWSDKEERLVVGQTEYGHPRYRFGEVLDRLLAGGDTRAAEAERAS